VAVVAHAGLAYDDSGTGDRRTIVLLHGWATGRTSMRPIFDALRAAYRVINVDLPGHGDSAVPDDEINLPCPLLLRTSPPYALPAGSRPRFSLGTASAAQ
jgi:pimeloyl-ACP methyl ester carboxylesterase